MPELNDDVEFAELNVRHTHNILRDIEGSGEETTTLELAEDGYDLVWMPENYTSNATRM